MMNKSKRTIIKTIFLGAFALMALLNVTFGQTKTDKIDALMNAYAEYGKFNGSVLVAEKGEIIYKKGFGLANMEWDIPNQPDTKFRLASITKQFTAMLIVQLVAEDKLKLDVPITSYLPDYPKKNGAIITVHHLLTHTSGIPNYTSFPNFRAKERNHYSPEELVGYFADSVLQFSPGEKFAYSNSGYVLLGAIIEKVTGKTYEQALQEKIFTPLNMKSTGYDHHSHIIKKRALGYNKRGGAFVNANYIDMSTPYAAGAIYSTVEDLYLWDQALYTEKLLPKKYLDLLFEEHTSAWRQHYGYGWEIGSMQIGNTDEYLQTISHGGGINGFNTKITRIPSGRSLILLLNNTSGAPLYNMTTAINGILYDKPYDFPKKSIANSLLEKIEKDGIAAALLHYKKIKESSDYHLNESEMNIVGYQLLQSDRAKESASVFKLNMEAFPNSFNVYDSYGEVLLVLGDTTQAIENYNKSVELNPDNKSGIKILKELGVNIVVQKKEDLYFLETDSTWRKEIFRFPLNFAPEIKFKGIEDARFPEGWGKEDSPNFWSYVFAWNIDHDGELTESELEINLQKYFDGLMKKQNTVAQIKKDNSSYIGEIKTFDAFFTKKPMTLNVVVDKYYCEQKKKTIILFKFSPKEIGHDVWLKLEEVKLPANVCDL